MMPPQFDDIIYISDISLALRLYQYVLHSRHIIRAYGFDSV